jgi:NADH-quinone oxidoreductase subunit H
MELYLRPAVIGVMIFVVFNALIIASAILVLAERKIMGFMQQRYGPYLVGPHGVLQPIADIVKLLFKEELRPKGADKWLFTLAPVLSILTAFVAFATVPFGAETTFFGLLDEPIKLGVADVNVAVLVVFAVTSMGVYGIVLAGWASNSKYSLFGGLRASAQMISYELAYATSLAAVIMLAGSLSLREVVDSQAGTWFGFLSRWYLFLQPLGFIIYVIAGVAETNRAPFDFPEAEQELVAGYNTEYSSVRFALFPQAEYINMVTMSAVATDLYLGGWHGLLPFYTPLDPLIEEYGLGWLAFLAKVAGFLFLYIWMRWTVPRYRYDQLMQFGWKWLFPASVINLTVTAALVLYLDA